MARPPPPPPSGLDPQIVQIFRQVDTDNSGHISNSELQRALSHTAPFNLKTIDVMMNVFDKDRNGFITIQEFAQLWGYISQWKQCFDAMDTDRSGSIDFNEMKNAMTQFGYRLSDQFIVSIMQKHDPQRVGSIRFDDFIQIFFLLQAMTNVFAVHDTDHDGWVQINYETFLMMVFNVV